MGIILGIPPKPAISERTKNSPQMPKSLGGIVELAEGLEAPTI
jgi:hypothetical protein